jgi:hypothetical protein
VSRACTDLGTTGDPPTPQVESDELAALRVRDVGVTPIRMRRRVARLAERFEHVRDPEGGDVDQADGTDLQVRDNGGVPRRLDAAGVGEGRDRLEDTPARCVDRKHARLEACGDENERPRAGGSGERAPLDCNGKRSREHELAPIHPPNTSAATWEVRLAAEQPEHLTWLGVPAHLRFERTSLLLA